MEEPMLCCLAGALLAGNLVLAWRLVASFADRPGAVVAGRATLACAAVVVPLATLAALAGHAGTGLPGPCGEAWQGSSTRRGYARGAPVPTGDGAPAVTGSASAGERPSRAATLPAARSGSCAA